MLEDVVEFDENADKYSVNTDFVKLQKSPYQLRAKQGYSHFWMNEIWHEGPGQVFEDDDIEKSNTKFRKENNDVLDEISNDGFMAYPVWAENRDGNLREFTAWLPKGFEPSCTEGFQEKHGMSTNIYIPSYERAGTAPTIKTLESFHVKNYYILIDPQQYPEYKKHYPHEHIVIRDIEFRRQEMLDEHSSIQRPMAMAGHAPLCNFVLSMSRSLGEDYFTFGDDDLVGFAMKAHKPDEIWDPAKVPYIKDNFYRCSNIKEEYGFSFQEFWHGLEELIRKARNPGFVGLEKFGTVFSLPVSFKTGTRVYSFYLTSNDTQVWHTGRQNNDVNTSIQLSKNGLVNILFEGISYNSEPTQSGGGQTDMYKKLGTIDKGKIIVRAQPNTVKISYKYSRIHHSGAFHPYNTMRVVGKPRDEIGDEN